MTSAKPRCFDDFAIGEDLPSLTKGPLSTIHLVRWSAAMENWHRIHFDHPYTVEHEGLKGLLINGTFKQQFIAQLLTDWARPDGWVWKMNFQFRAMNIVGERLTLWARVADKRQAPDFGLVDVEMGIVNEHGVESTPGTAIVAFPYRHKQPLPYPFVAPVPAEIA